jgi:hypothetical protein
MWIWSMQEAAFHVRPRDSEQTDAGAVIRSVYHSALEHNQAECWPTLTVFERMGDWAIANVAGVSSVRDLSTRQRGI